jgi:FKBP-type peptidyl-prolyl cis-trans isomerase FkpA
MYRKMKIISIILVASLAFSECKKSTCDKNIPSDVAPTNEITIIKNYLMTNGITATQHESGLFYRIVSQGSGSSPSLCSNVSVQYKGTLINGTLFDESKTTITFNLGNLIKGWQIGIPLLKKGGEATFYIPPSLGYGSNATSGIPANSTLIFELRLIAFQSSN